MNNECVLSGYLDMGDYGVDFFEMVFDGNPIEFKGLYLREVFMDSYETVDEVIEDFQDIYFESIEDFKDDQYQSITEWIEKNIPFSTKKVIKE